MNGVNSALTLLCYSIVFNLEQIFGNVANVLVRNTKVATIKKFDKEFVVEFEVNPKTFQKGWHNVIHFTIGSNHNKYGDRVPGVWFDHSGNGALHIAAPVNGNLNRWFNTKPLKLNEWTYVRISQQRYGGTHHYQIRVNDDVVLSEQNSQAHSFENVVVYASDPWYNAADGSIKKFNFINGNAGKN